MRHNEPRYGHSVKCLFFILSAKLYDENVLKKCFIYIMTNFNRYRDYGCNFQELNFVERYV